MERRIIAIICDLIHPTLQGSDPLDLSSATGCTGGYSYLTGFTGWNLSEFLKPEASLVRICN